MSKTDVICYRNDPITTHEVDKGDYIVNQWFINDTLLPDGIEFDNGVITCNSTKTYNKTGYRITAANTEGNGTLDITIMVDLGLLRSVEYAVNEMVFPFEYYFSFDKPIIDGDSGGFEISSKLPIGIDIDEKDGHFYGSASEITNRLQQYAVTIKNPRTPLTYSVEIKTERKIMVVKIEFYCPKDSEGEYIYNQTATGQYFVLPCLDYEDGFHRRYCKYNELNNSAIWDTIEITCSNRIMKK